jgi:hypothetical protein
MTFDIDKEKLAAYVLGELDETEREAVEKALEADKSLRATVAELRATANLAAKALQAEPAHELTDSQRAAISKRAEAASTGARGRGLCDWRNVARLWKRPLAGWQIAVAAVLILAVVWAMVTPSVVYRTREQRDRAMVADRGYAPVYNVPFSDAEVAPSFGRVGTPGGMGRFGGGGFGVGGFGGGGRGRAIQPFFADGGRGLAEEKEEVSAADDSLAMIEPSQPGRYLIKNASVLIETEDARKASETLVATLQDLGGYVSDLRESVDSLGRRSIHVQIRVPADKFDATMQQLEPLGKVLNREISTEDVTEEFVDTDARVRNLKATEERLLKHFERTGDLEGIVEIERELNRIREQIERLQGRLRYLSNRVDFSTFNIVLQEKPKKEPMVPPETFSVAKVASEATRRLVGFFQNLTARIIWLAIWSVVWVPLVAVAIFLIRRALRQARKAQD